MTPLPASNCLPAIAKRDPPLLLFFPLSHHLLFEPLIIQQQINIHRLKAQASPTLKDITLNTPLKRCKCLRSLITRVNQTSYSTIVLNNIVLNSLEVLSGPLGESYLIV